MIVEAQVTINGSKAATWDAITNIESASEIISKEGTRRWSTEETDFEAIRRS